MKIKTYEKDIETLDRIDPGWSKEFYPRRIVCPHGYVDPRYYSMCAWAGCSGIRIGPDTDTRRVALCCINQFLKLDCPTYFVAPDFALAINATNPPEDMTIDDIKFPMETMLFVLPDKFIQATYKWMIPFICVSRVARGNQLIHPGVVRVAGVKQGDVTLEGSMFCVHSPFFPNDGLAISYGGWYPSDFTISKLLTTDKSRFQDDLALQKAYVSKIHPEWGDDVFKHESPVPSPEEDQAIPLQFTMLALKIIMAMTCRPQLITTGGLARPEKKRDGRIIRDALWSPHFIGFNYKIQRAAGETPTGTHASPRVHWRMGHWHTVLHGKGRALRRVDWFEPALINAAR